MSPRFKLKALLLATSMMVLTACGETEEEVLTYNTVQDCIRAGVKDEQTCRAEFDKAQRLHTEVAPRYSGAQQCYSDYGYDRCRRHSYSSGSSFWLPLMVGYMIAPRSGSYFYSQPLYRPSHDPNRYYTAGNGRLGEVSRDGRTRVAKSQTKRPPVRTRTVSRGGFGRRSVSSGG